jgi:plastocyanin
MPKVATALVAGLGLLGGISCSSSPPPPATCASPVTTTIVTLADFSFTPACTAVAPGATLTLMNAGTVPHTFTVPGTSVNVTLAAGETKQVTLSGLAAGTYRVVCTIHPTMVGSLKVG